MIAIAGYSDIVRIGQGGLGDVYRATRESTGGIVAIKVLRDVSDQSVVWHRTRRELTALVSLTGHANVIALVEMLDLAEGPALVMEFAPGGSIADLLQRRDEPLSVGESVLVGRHTAAALVAAHAQGIVHRDVKPQNLLIDAYGQVKLCDFGIAAMARSEEFEARTNAISMRYASPEDLDDEIDVGPPSDVYSLGATLLHLARGAPPSLKQRLAPWVPPPTDDPDLAALDAIVATCLQPAPAARPTAAQVVDELERLSWSMDERNRSIPSAADVYRDERPSEPEPPPVTVEPARRSDAAADEISPLPAAVPPRHTPEAAPFATEATLTRPDRRPPSRPAPPPEPEGHRRTLVMVGLAVIVLVSAVVLFWWFRGDGGADGMDDDLVRLVDGPGGLTDVSELGWPFGPTGACLVQEAGAEVLVTVPCEQPHDLQRIAVGALPPTSFPAGAPFDAESVRSAVRATCTLAFAEFVGVEPELSEFDAPFAAPSESTWPSGDRTFQCLVGVPGMRLVGDVAGSGR